MDNSCITSKSAPDCLEPLLVGAAPFSSPSPPAGGEGGVRGWRHTCREPLLAGEVSTIPDVLQHAREISVPPRSTIRYSICTLVNKKSEYAEMVQSFIAAGFDPAFCEFLYLDNSVTNKFDAYRGYNLFLNRARGERIILCHQDILLLDHRLEDLEQCIQELDARDPHWALLGNAGGVALGNTACRITDVDGDHNSGIFPTEVGTLDENFILVKNAANLSLSRDLHGYHLYGTDLCLIARLLGYRAWVVNFNLFHKSRGNCDQHFKRLKQELIQKYRAAFRGRYVETTCTRFYLSGSRLHNLTFGIGLVRSSVKRWNRFKRKWANSFRKRRRSLALFLSRKSTVAPAVARPQRRSEEKVIGPNAL